MARPATLSGPLRIALFAYPDVQALDLSGPLEMFARATRILREEHRAHPGYALKVVGTEAGPIAASSGFRFLPDTTWRTLRSGVDTLLVVGGRGVDALLTDRGILGWVRGMARRVRRLGSVCTGAFLLAEAGLLDGRTVSTHWSRAAELARRYPKVRVEEDRIWVRDGNVYTSAGVSAGMDLALALIEEDLGAEVALAVARAMVMYVRRPGDQSQYSAPLRLQAANTPSLRDLVAWAAEHPASDLSVPALARRVGKSPRHLTRVFRNELGIAPAEAIEQLPLEAARRALQQSAAGLVGPFAAALMERFGIRRTVLVSLALICAGVAFTSQMSASWQLLLTWGVLVGLGTGTTAMVLGATVVNRWFVRRRGAVMGALTASTATGQMLFLPLEAHVVEHQGSRAVTARGDGHLRSDRDYRQRLALGSVRLPQAPLLLLRFPRPEPALAPASIRRAGPRASGVRGVLRPRLDRHRPSHPPADDG